MQLDFDNWFATTEIPPAMRVAGDYEPGMVLLSLVVAVGASWVALLLADQARASTQRLNRLVAQSTGALALGAGVWAMHFIGMLAFQLCAPVRYDPVITAASMVPSLAAAWVALRLLSRRSLTLPVVVGSGVLTGAGIGAMHYGGMVAMDMAPNLVFDVGWFLASIVVAVVLAVLALCIAFGLGRRRVGSKRGARLLAAGVMGLAITGMHYTGMAAARFVGETDPDFVPDIGHHIPLAVALAVVALAIGGIAFASNVLLRYYQVRQQALQSESRLRSLVANMPGVAFRLEVAATVQVVFVSDAIESLTGWPASHFKGEASDFDVLTHPDDRARVNAAVADAVARLGSYAVEYRLLHRDGSERWVSHSGGCMRDPDSGACWIDGVVFDITEARARNAEFRTVATVLDRAMAVLEIDTRGRILRANTNYLDLLGYASLDEIVGRPYEDMVPPRLRAQPTHLGHMRAMLAGEVVAGEFQRLARDGRELWIQSIYNPVHDDAGRLQKIMAFKTDITPRKAMERELREAKVRAEHAAAARSAFLANMSHEIRTPMNAIIGFTDVLLTTPLAPAQRRHLETVRNAAQSLLGLLNGILDTAKLEKGAMELELADFSLRALCEQVAASMRLGAEKKGLQLELDYPDALPAYYRGDALRVQQVLVNLVGNAIKFTESGRVAIRVRQDRSNTVISVQDTGVGIPPDRIGRIFDAFAQADATVTRKFGGTGLGTTIARQLVELMGGQITVTSVLGQGSCFEVSLPLAFGQEPVSTTLPPTLELPPLDILVADDVPQNVELLELVLGAEGHRVSSARNGREALERLATQRFDVVLMDMHMPEMDGLSATRALRAREHAQGLVATPIVALTASVQAADRHAALEAGMDGFATKPVVKVQLQKEIARVLGLREATQPATLMDASGPQPAGDMALVDWQQGLGLWQTQERLVAAIAAFLRSNAPVPEALHALLLQADLPGLAALAHRVSGAAGNLSLTALRAAAQALEHAARTGDAAASAQCVAQVVQQLHAAQVLVPHADGGQPDIVLPESDAPDPAQTLAQLAQLRHALVGNALDEASLEALGQALPPAQLRALLDAIDNFDFQRAAECVEALQRVLQQDMKGQA